MITVQATTCSDCKQMIYSRARHDFHYCKCEATFVDGGFDYHRVGGHPANGLTEIKLEATIRDLYDDWNYHKDKYGWVQ